MGPHSTCWCLCGLFHLTRCYQGSCVVWHQHLCSTAQLDHVLFILSIQPVMHISMVATFLVLWIVYKFLLNVCFQSFLSIYLEVELLDPMVILCLKNYVFLFLRSCQTVSHRGFHILYFHQQRLRVLFSPHPLQQDKTKNTIFSFLFKKLQSS